MRESRDSTCVNVWGFMISSSDMAQQRDITTVETVAEMQSIARKARNQGLSVGCVPTMGYLHEGHASLIHRAASENDLVVVSIFVNPTQFAPGEDFERYPRSFERDLEVVAQAGGTHVFAPSIEEMYPGGARSDIHIDGVTEVLEGASRPTHFDGVATVVSRLFEAMQPDVAYFGQKDYQQTLVIRRMVQTSTLDDVRRVRIEVLPTVREPGNLARSSRNVYLTADQRAQASILHDALRLGADMLEGGLRNLDEIEHSMRQRLSTVDDLVVDYAVAVDANTLRAPMELTTDTTIALLVAARLGSTRLIDNMLVTLK